MESAPKEPWLVAIAASAGGIQAIQSVLSAVPPDLSAAFVIVLHRAPTRTSHLESILAKKTRMPVRTARDGETIQPRTVYIARPDLHLTVTPTRQFQHVDGTRV